MNTKRALKTLAKMNKTIYYQIVNEDITLVSDGHMVANIYTSEWDELKDICFKKNVRQEFDLLKVMRDNNHDKVQARQTSIIIHDNYDRDLVIFKYHDDADNVKFRAINKVYIDIVHDLCDSIYGFETRLDDRFAPIMSICDTGETFYGGWLILPIHHDVRNILENVLNI